VIPTNTTTGGQVLGHHQIQMATHIFHASLSSKHFVAMFSDAELYANMLFHNVHAEL